MILNLHLDTADATDMKAFRAIVAAVFPETVRTVATCSSIMETARRRSAGENVIYKSEPKKRGRKPKHPKE